MSRRHWIPVALATAALPMAQAALADTYTIDPAHTYPSLEMSHMGISVWRGKFDRTSGTVVLDLAAKTGTADVTVETGSIDFGLAAMHDMAIKPDWLNVAKFPTMTYRGTLKFQGDVPVAVDGQLTLRGVTKPLRLKINSFKCIPHPMTRKELCGADAEGELNRADYGMTQYTENDAARIRLRIQVEAVKEG